MAVKNLINKVGITKSNSYSKSKKWIVFLYERVCDWTINIAKCDTRREARNVKRALQEIHTMGGYHASNWGGRKATFSQLVKEINEDAKHPR